MPLRIEEQEHCTESWRERERERVREGSLSLEAIKYHSRFVSCFYLFSTWAVKLNHRRHKQLFRIMACFSDC